jgi:DMSO reductase anchor subunit
MPPHTSENYLQNEMGFVVARKHAQKLRAMAILLGGVLPVAIVWFAGGTITPQSQAALALALGSHIAGVFVERWLFFAEAKHVVTLYYGDAH